MKARRSLPGLKFLSVLICVIGVNLWLIFPSRKITTANGESDVKVDAGDGRVLHAEKDGEDN